MNKLRLLAKLTTDAVKNGHQGIFTTDDLALMLRITPDISFRKYLYTAVKAGVLKKVATNLYYNPDSHIPAKYVLEKIAKLLHWDKFIYVSLESQLSHIGKISQIPMKYLTVMTTGRKGEVNTCFGVIEFTHTARAVDTLLNDVYYDSDADMYRASEKLAIRDLKRVGRNLTMLEESFENVE
jgi:hypothetical protein